MEALTTRDIEDTDKLAEVLEEYKRFKRNFAENLVFDPEKSFLNRRQIVPLAEKEYAPLQLIQIYFDSNTFDEIQIGLKLTPESQLGLIGGTMGLFTGFSIISAIEIIYFVMKFFLSLKISKNKVLNVEN